MDVRIETSWKEKLAAEFELPYFLALNEAVRKAYHSHTPVFPAPQNIFSAFTLCPFSQVKVVILGQDPYHGEGQAHGLAFSVPEGMPVPPSLRNIYKELSSDLEKETPQSGNLEHWGKQGVLLLNTTLTVVGGQPGSHQGLGWETFTDAVIKKISEEKEHVVFLLWGKFAHDKAAMIDDTKHLILKAPHPSPLSAYTGFFGSKHFSTCNTYLTETDQTPIEW